MPDIPEESSLIKDEVLNNAANIVQQIKENSQKSIEKSVKKKFSAVGEQFSNLFDVDMEREYTEEELLVMQRRLKIKKNLANISIGIIYFIILLHTLLLGIGELRGIYNVGYTKGTWGIYTSLFFVIGAILAWGYSTREDIWNYHKLKLFLIKFIMFMIALTVTQFILIVIDQLFVPLLGFIPVKALMTADIIIFIGRLAMGIPSALVLFFIFYKLSAVLKKDEVKENILSFRIDNIIDFRKDKQFAFDMKVVRHLDTGHMHVIYEKDRSLHAMAVGVTGTGKTSSCMTTAIEQDLGQKRYNEDYQRKELLRMLEEKKVVLKKPFLDEQFTINNFESLESGEREFDKLRRRVHTCGITVLAPNASLTDDVYNIAVSKGISTINRIDPVLVKGVHKPGFIGFNPLYISKGMTRQERALEVVKKSIILADVMQALYEMGGKGDPYFTGLNRSLTTTITILLLHTYERIHPGKNPTLIDVQEIINDFSKALPYLQEFERMIHTMSAEELGFEPRDLKFVVDVFRNKLFKPKVGDEIFKQANGLQNQFNEFLSNTLFSSVLCAQNSVDLDEILKNGEITVVNYALEYGRSSAVAFGLFFAMNFNNAVLRRPEGTRIPHFYYADELAILIHESWETNFTLFRQYNTNMFVAFQTLDQMKKSSTTEYLMGVLLGNCSTQFLFGRLSPTEMEYYESIGGTKMSAQEQETISQSALSDINTTKSRSLRTTMQEENVVTGSRMRYRGFQEVTMFTVKNGTPLPPFYGKVGFLPKERRLKKKRNRIDWSVYFDTIEDQKLVREFLNKNVEPGEDARNNVLAPVSHINIGYVEKEEKSGGIYMSTPQYETISSNSVLSSGKNDFVEKTGKVQGSDESITAGDAVFENEVVIGNDDGFGTFSLK